MPNRIAMDILEQLDGSPQIGSPFIDGWSMAGSSFAPGRISLTLGMLIVEQDPEIQEMDQMEIQEAVQEAIMGQEVQEVDQEVQEVVQEVVQERVQMEVQAGQAVLTDLTIHLTEVIMEVMEMQQL